MDAEKMKAAELKAAAVVEKHLEAMATELTDVAKEMGDIAATGSNPFVAMLIQAGAPQLVNYIKALIPKLDLNKDGQ